MKNKILNRLKYCFWFNVFVCGTILINFPAIAALSHEFNLKTNTKSEFEFSLNKNLKSRVTINQNILTLQAISEKPVSFNVSKPYNDLLHIIIEDYNFDGWQDIAVQTSVGYGGLNVFYDIFIFNPATRLYEKSLTELNEPRVNSDEKTIVCGGKSGTQILRETYSISDGKLFLSSSSSELVGTGVKRLVKTDAKGQILGVSMIDYEGNPVQLKIKSERAFLYLQPLESAKTQDYLVKGDIVTLRDYKSENGDWYLIQHSKQTQPVQWIKFEDIDWQ